MSSDSPSTETSAGLPSPLAGYLADPNLAVLDGTFMLYPTTDGTENWAATSFSAFSSPDLVSWKDHGVILELGTHVAWARVEAWAPAIGHRSDKYYLYFTAESNIGVATADSPFGPFVDLGRPLVADGQFSGRAIDPAVFVDGDGKSYLYWGNGEAHVVELGPDMISFDHSKVVTWTPTEFREAPWVHKRRGIYYLSWSVDDTRSANYRVRYATGSSPYGPWTDRGILLEKVPDRGILATGHHSIVNVPNTDDWIIAYHRFAIPGGDGFHREVSFDRLVYNADGTIQKVVPSSEPLRIPLQPERFGA